MSLVINGIGCSNPPHTMSQVEALEMTLSTFRTKERNERLLRVAFRKSGVANRYTSLHYSVAHTWMDSYEPGAFNPGPGTQKRMQYYREHATPLAVQAAEQAFEMSASVPEHVTHVVTVSCTGFDAPGVDFDLIRELGMPATTQRVNVGFMGCHGAINGLRVAHGLVAANPEAVVLLCAVECCSVHYQLNWQDDQSLGSVLFSDGAAAMICRNNQHASKATVADLVATGSCLLPDCKDAITWSIGDNGFEMMLSQAVPKLIKQHLRPWVDRWLLQHNLRLDDIDSWAVHPGGPKIIDSVESSLELQPADTEISRGVLRDYGNMSSPTILFVLEEMRRQQKNGLCLAIAFGPGVCAEAALLRLG